MKDSESKTRTGSHAIANQAVQKKSAGKSLPSHTAQLQAEEEELQMKAVVQEQAEEEELQMKPIVQKQGEEEELQMKSIVQKQAAEEEEVQMKENNTGLPDNLKAGVESLSGAALDDVNVHYNSAQPAQLNAHAFAQGNDIHVAAGQEKHLPHEAWHVAQQKQGRVKPSFQKEGVSINDDPGLESEADVMGAKALQKYKK